MSSSQQSFGSQTGQYRTARVSGPNDSQSSSIVFKTSKVASLAGALRKKNFVSKTAQVSAVQSKNNSNNSSQVRFVGGSGSSTFQTAKAKPGSGV